MQIRQWENEYLSHFSYAVLSECEKKIILIDPTRNPRQYYDYAAETGAVIAGIIETHPHADFISGHLEISQHTGAPVYLSKLVTAAFPHISFDHNGEITLGNISLSAINTPGHSPDSICILLKHHGLAKAIFTGDTLFVGDCGRPDLRSDQENALAQKEMLARQMYYSLREKISHLDDGILVYPAHGAGTLCGKALSDALSSTIGAEKATNWSLQNLTETEFTQKLLKDLPFVPAYFAYDVDMNRKGADPFVSAVRSVPISPEDALKTQSSSIRIIDTRDETEFKHHHHPNSINLMEDTRFETWLGTLIIPRQPFLLSGSSQEQLRRMIARCASIGYEPFIQSAFVVLQGSVTSPKIDTDEFRRHQENYTIVDVRNQEEVKEKKIFENSLWIPLHELPDRIHEVPTGKPIVVHCAGGFRSAAASSLLASSLPDNVSVLDLGKAIKEFD